METDVDRLKERLTALACAVCLCAGLMLPASAAEGGYVDVPVGSWYADAVDWVAGEGYMTGVDASHFAPTATVTRATVLTVLWRMEGSPVMGAAATFSDVPTGTWYAQAAAWAQSAYIASGDGQGRLDPDGSITRQELAVLLTRYDRYKGVALAEGALNLFSDAGEIAAWAQDGMRHAIGMGWLEGSGDQVQPTGPVSRAQLAAILQRMNTPAAG